MKKTITLVPSLSQKTRNLVNVFGNNFAKLMSKIVEEKVTRKQTFKIIMVLVTGTLAVFSLCSSIWMQLLLICLFLWSLANCRKEKWN